MKTIYYIAGLLLLFSCEEKTLDPITPSEGKPQVVTAVEVENIAGGAIISYQIPENKDILAVKAVYTTTNGKKREADASFYDNQLLIEGYNDENEHEVLLYSINRAQEYSDAVSVKIQPLESALIKTARSVSIVPNFGGATISWENEERAPLTFELLSQDKKGDMQTVRVLSSNLITYDYTFRGYEPVPQKFAVIISDNFGNESQPIYPPGDQLTPLVERKLDKLIQKVLILDGDVTFSNWTGRNEYIIDDNLDTYGHSYTGTMSTGASFTLDLGERVKLSRFINYQRGDDGRWFKAGNAKTMEVYIYLGDETQPPVGNWTQWEKIMDCAVIKPSGLGTTVTDEDIIAAQNGHEFAFSMVLSPQRYLRFKCLSVWGNWPGDASNYWHPQEITTYGGDE
ncbi:MAG: DUF4959 domain-containing protein [Candidatus Symbiothrix sp.]|jgi:hypothetical protein|nr:DUF4959 domain-containing protein [Candidatus Symbiothrix sp.]